MPRPSFGRLLPALFASVALLAQTHTAAAQAEMPKPKKVRFDSFDKVELNGTFYPSAKGGQVPGVIVIHSSEGNRKQAGYDDLAKKLQENYAVLTFDFRGHGDSTAVSPQFWQFPENQRLRGANPNKNSISYKDFHTDYWPMLVNDITAAKRFLDVQNDAGQCNSSNTILIAAGDATALTAYFLVAEWKRSPTQPGVFGVPTPVAGQVAGQDIVCVAWLSMAKSFKGNSIPATVWFGPQQQLPLREKVAMYFMYGDQDATSKTYSESLFKLIKARNNKQKWTGALGIPRTKLAGHDLLKTSLPTVENIQKFVTKVLDENGLNPPQKKNAEQTQLLQVPSGILQQARTGGAAGSY